MALDGSLAMDGSLGVARVHIRIRITFSALNSLRTPQNNPIGYENGTISEQHLQNFSKAKFTMIHGTGDDNVHFQNGALISKALIKAGIEFNNYFYADEAHHMVGAADQHVYRLIFRKIRDCYNGFL